MMEALLSRLIKSEKTRTQVAYYLRIVGTLFLITAVVAILLSAVNALTKPTIDRLAEEKKQAAMVQVMPNATSFSAVTLPEDVPGVLDVQLAKDEGAIMGCCVQVASGGFGGELQLMVGVDINGAVTGVSILSHSETVGIPSHPWLLAQYAGRSGVIGVSKNSADAENIQAISGATVTSKAVTAGVNNALRAATLYLEGGVGE